MRPRSLLESYPTMMALGLSLGLVTGGFPSHTKEVSMASLAFLMTLSLSTVKLAEARGRGQVKHAATAVLLNYGALTALILLLGLFFSEDLWWGWALMAAAPSAVAVVPFTSVLGGPTAKALFSTAVIYVLALALMPLITLLLIGYAVSVSDLLISLLLLIVLPMALSRGVARIRIGKSTSAIMTNISFAVLIFAVAGSNRDAFLGGPMTVLAISLACMVRTFGIGLAVEGVLRLRGMPREERTTHVLFASYKNLGLTATLAIALFEPIVAVPATICIVFEVVWMIFLLKYYPGAGTRAHLIA